jgi:hypothetical protein
MTGNAVTQALGGHRGAQREEDAAREPSEQEQLRAFTSLVIDHCINWPPADDLDGKIDSVKIESTLEQLAGIYSFSVRFLATTLDGSCGDELYSIRAQGKKGTRVIAILVLKRTEDQARPADWTLYSCLDDSAG